MFIRTLKDTPRIRIKPTFFFFSFPLTPYNTLTPFLRSLPNSQLIDTRGLYHHHHHSSVASLKNMKRTHLASFSSINQTQEEDTNVDNSIIKNHYKNYEAGLIPWPPKNYTCSFCRREFRSAQALGGHMNVHRRDRAKLKQIPSWLFESNPNFTSSSSLTIPAHHEASQTNQGSKTTPFSSPRFDLLDKTTSCGGLMGETEKNKNNVCRRELKKSEVDACHAKRCEMSRVDLMNKRDEVMGLELEMGLRNPQQVLDLELRLGYL